MERKEFEKCCQALEEGEEIYLENMTTHETAKALYCSGDEFQVKVDDKRKTWSPQSCEELSSSSESPNYTI